MIYLNRRQVSQARMIENPTLMVSYRSEIALGRALAPTGPVPGRLTRTGAPGPTVEQFVRSYVKQLNTIKGLPEIVQDFAKGHDQFTFLSYYGDQADECPTHLVIVYLVRAAPRMFTDSRGYTKITDQTLARILDGEL